MNIFINLLLLQKVHINVNKTVCTLKLRCNQGPPNEAKGRGLLIIFLRGGKFQGSKEIRQWPINLCTLPMMIHKITLFVDWN